MNGQNKNSFFILILIEIKIKSKHKNKKDGLRRIRFFIEKRCFLQEIYKFFKMTIDNMTAVEYNISKI